MENTGNSKEMLRKLLEKIEKQQQIISHISSLPLIEHGDVEKLSACITEVAVEVTGVERSGIWLFNEDETELRCIDLYEATLRQHSCGYIRSGHEFSAEFSCLKSSKYIASDDPLSDTETRGYAETYLKPLHITSMLASVIKYSGKNSGIICFEHVDRKHHWEYDEISFACQLADQIAFAISNRKKKDAEEVMKKKEERYSRIAATIPCILYDYILYPDGKSKFLYISPRCYDILELKQEALLDDITQLENIIHREDISRLREENERAVREGVIFNIEVRIITPSGKLKWIHMSSLPNTPEPEEPVVWSGFIMDITDRKTVEEALKKKTEEVEKFFNSALDLLCIADTDGYFHRLNPEWEHTLGYSVKELEGKKFLDFVHPDDMKATLDAMTTLSGNKEVLNFINRYRGRDGSYRWIEWRSYPAGKFIYAAARDITDRIRTEEALRESEARYRRIIDTAYEGICIMNSNFIITSVNDRMAEMTGYNIDEIIGKNLDEFIFPEDMQDHYKNLEQRKKGFSQQYERKFRKKDGSPVWTIVSATPMYNPAGHFSGSFAMFTDITERKKTEEALRESEARLEEAQSIAHVGYWEHNLLTDKIICSGETYRILGIKEQEKDISLSLLLEHIHYEDRDAVSQVFSEALKDERTSDIEHRVLHDDGTIRYVHCHGDVTHDHEGQAVKIFGTVLDITELKLLHEEKLEIERKLLQAQKLESLGIMAGGIAHDFNNILMIILTNLELAMMDIPNSSPVLHAIEGAIKAGKRASELTAKMLAYCGKGRLIINKIKLNDIIEKNIKLLSNSITNSSVIINLNIDKELPFIEGDGGKVEQLIIALFTNALEALEGRDGIITIATGLKECDISYLSKSRLDVIPEPGVFAYLEIKDTGCGMDEETQKKIFDPFFTTKFTGRGLGMSAVIGIVKSHRGAIFVESIKNIGTTVTVILPLYRTECPEQYREIPGKKVTPLQARTILLVDDEDMLRESGKAILTRFGFNVITASDGVEAVEVYTKRSAEINCIIMDLSMPRMDGLTALKKIRQVNPGIKVILCSGYNEQTAIGNYTGYGLAGFLQKPYEIEKLRKKLKDIY